MSTSTVSVGRTRDPHAFSGGRIVVIVVASLVALVSIGVLAGGIAAVVFDQTQRGHDGYLSTGTQSYSTGTYALVSDSYRAGTSADRFAARELLGTVRISVTSTRPIFLGIAPAAKADGYLAGMRHEQGSSFGDFQVVAGGAPAAPPGGRSIWAASTTGAGTRELVWKPKNGAWRVVLMNADASAGINAEMDIGAKFPHLLAIGLGVGGLGLVLLLAASAAMVAAFRRAPRAP